MILGLAYYNPIQAEATCSYARCHTVGEGFCLPGHQISLRESCDYWACVFTEDCDFTWEPPT